MACGEELPDADLERLACDKEDLCCGIIVFDAWIANTDRHNGNVWYDYYADKCAIFDHGQALLGPFGEATLNSSHNKLAIRTDNISLASVVRSMNDFPSWYDRICEIPNATIVSTCQQAAAVGVEQSLAQQCASWLIERKEALPQLFRDNSSALPKLQPTLFKPFGSSNEFFPEYCI